MRVVLDTNVVVSGLLFGGQVGQIVDKWKSKSITPLASKPMIEEYYRVLAYPKFHLTHDEIFSLIENHFLMYADIIHPKPIAPVILNDPSDDIFLACAYYGKAKCIVSGDRHLLDLKKYMKIPIVTVKEFIDSY